ERVEVQQVHEVDDPEQDRRNRASFPEQMNDRHAGLVLLAGDELIRCRRMKCRIDAIEPVRELVGTLSAQRHELQRLRQSDEHRTADQKGDDAAEYET